MRLNVRPEAQSGSESEAGELFLVTSHRVPDLNGFQVLLSKVIQIIH